MFLNLTETVIILNELLKITSFYRTRDSRGGSVSPPPSVQLRTVEVRNPNYSSLKKGVYWRLILFYLNTWIIFRFHDFMGDFRLSGKKFELLEYGRAIYRFNKGIRPGDFEYAICSAKYLNFAILWKLIYFAKIT